MKNSPQKKEEPTCTCKIGEGYCLIHSGEPIEHKKEEPTNKSIEKQIAWCECGDGLIQQEDGDYYCIGCDDTYKLVKVKKEEPTCEQDWQYNSDIKGVAQCSKCDEYQLPKKEEPAMELNEEIMRDLTVEEADLAILFGKECCTNEHKPVPCLNCKYKAKQVIRFGYSKVKLQSGLKVKDVCELPKPYSLVNARTIQFNTGYNTAIGKIAELPVKLQGKGLVELDRNELLKIKNRILENNISRPCSWLMLDFINIICSKFGVAQPSISREDVEISLTKFLVDYPMPGLDYHPSDYSELSTAILNHLESRKA